jgi:hypothetical protein
MHSHVEGCRRRHRQAHHHPLRHKAHHARSPLLRPWPRRRRSHPRFGRSQMASPLSRRSAPQAGRRARGGAESYTSVWKMPRRCWRRHRSTGRRRAPDRAHLARSQTKCSLPSSSDHRGLALRSGTHRGRYHGVHARDKSVFKK